MDTLKYERSENGVGLLTLSRPKQLNAINRQLLDELDGLLAELEADAGLRAQ